MKLNLKFFMKFFCLFFLLCLLSIQSKAANSFTDSTTNTFTWDANKAFQTIRIGYNVGFKPYGVTNLNLKDQNVTSVIFAEMDIYDNNGIFFEFVNQPMMHIDEGLQELDFVFTSYSFYYDLYVRSRSYSVGYVHTFQLSESMDLSARGSIGRMDMDIREYATDKETLEVDQYEHSEKSTIASLSGKFTYWLPNNVGLSAEAAIGYYAPIAKLGLTYRIKTL